MSSPPHDSGEGAIVEGLYIEYRFILFLIVAVAVTTGWPLGPSQANGEQDQGIDCGTVIDQAVVWVLAGEDLPDGGGFRPRFQGTGFFISRDGYLLTAHHLKANLDKELKGRAGSFRIGWADTPLREALPVEIAREEPERDRMVLKANGTNYSVLSSDPWLGGPSEGSSVVVAGFPEGDRPHGLESIQKAAGVLTVDLARRYSSLPPDTAQDLNPFHYVYQTTARIEGGLSGGPVLQIMDGKPRCDGLVGIGGSYIVEESGKEDPRGNGYVLELPNIAELMEALRDLSPRD